MCGASGNIARGTLLTLLLTLLLALLVVVLDRLDAVGELTLFVLAGAALIPLSWLIGEATDNLARHTGPGIGGFLNATFGNAPELIIAIIAVSGGLAAIVRASLVGSIASNLLLVLGFTLLFGQRGYIDRLSAYISLGFLGFAIVVLLAAAVPGFHGDPDRHSLAKLSLPLAVLLLVVCLIVTRYALRRQWQLFRAAEPEGSGWPCWPPSRCSALRRSLPPSSARRSSARCETFASTVHLSEFFVAVVIVAIIGNATEHGSAVLLARRGRVKLATEIPLASSAQIAGLVIPLVALISWAFTPLALSFRPVELGGHGGSGCSSGARSADRQNDQAERSDPPGRLLGSRRRLLPGRRRLTRPRPPGHTERGNRSAHKRAPGRRPRIVMVGAAMTKETRGWRNHDNDEGRAGRCAAGTRARLSRGCRLLDVHYRGHARRAVGVKGEQHVVAGEQDALIAGQLEGVGGPVHRRRGQRDAALVVVDPMRVARHADQRERRRCGSVVTVMSDPVTALAGALVMTGRVLSGRRD